MIDYQATISKRGSNSHMSRQCLTIFSTACILIARNAWKR